MEFLARFRPHQRGFGFLHLVGDDLLTANEVTIARDDGPAVIGDRAFVPPPLARGLVADDLVMADIQADDRGLSAATITIRARPRTMLVGTVVEGPGRLVLDPDRALATGWVDLDPAVVPQLRGAAGRIAVVLRSTGEDGRPVARALVAGPFVAGSPQAVRATATVVACERAAVDLIPGGPEGAGLEPTDASITHARFVGIVAGGGRGAAAGLSPSVTPLSDLANTDAADTEDKLPNRSALMHLDRTAEVCVTVDSPSARDLDDAVGAAWSGDHADPVKVQVHIADAAGAVEFNSPADLYARTVASTTYPTIGSNAPMLDPELSESSLSLIAGQRRHVVSVRFDVTSTGAIENVAIEAATIVSDARLSYQSVEHLLDGDDAAVRAEVTTSAHQSDQATSDDILATVTAAIEAARRLGIDRDARMTFDELFSSAEWEPALVDGKLTVIAAESEARAYRLIERLMVAANEAVAAFLASQGIPALYRVHAGLDPDRLERLQAAVTHLDIEAPGLAPEGDPAGLMGEVLAAIDQLAADGNTDARDLLVAVATGTMARASYDPDPSHHRGLASAAYTHFTSPIRRYADLTVHRQLRAALAGEPPPWSAAQLAGLAVWLDHRTGALSLMQATERRALWALLLDRGHIDGDHTAVVTGLTTNGVRIRLPALGLGGFITAERALGLPAGQRGTLTVDDHGLTTTSGPWNVGTMFDVRFVGLDEADRPIWRLAQDGTPSS
ncbi:MAG: RNB domain-containing ribonuclease [Nitriliruptoraceae bacterium]